MPLESNEDLLPIEWASEVIAEMAQTSAALGLSRRRTMSTRTQRLPATSLLAGAFWVDGEAGLKSETNAEWKGVNLIVEELAALVAIPHAYELDNAFPVWDETRPQLVEAMGTALDAAVFFGVNKPASWPDDLMTSITAAGNTVAEGTFDDLAADISESARALKSTGYTTNAFAVEPGFGWRLTGLRSEDGHPIYQTDLAGPRRTGLYGFPMGEVGNGAWDSDEAVTIHGDFSKSLIGIRQDISFTRHEDAVITDTEGAVTFNAVQQDSTIWRAVFRVAWARANPATRLGPNPNEDTGKFPFAAITPPAP